MIESNRESRTIRTISFKEALEVSIKISKDIFKRSIFSPEEALGMFESRKGE